MLSALVGICVFFLPAICSELESGASCSRTCKVRALSGTQHENGVCTYGLRGGAWPWSDPQNECHPVLDIHDTRSYHFWAVDMLEDLGHLTWWGLHGAPGARLDHDLN